MCFQLSTLLNSTQSQGTIVQTSRINRARYSQLNETLAITKSLLDSRVALLNRHIIASRPAHLEIKIWTKSKRRSTTEANIARKSHLKIYHLYHRNVQRMEALLSKQSKRTCPLLWNRTKKLITTLFFQTSLGMVTQSRTTKPRQRSPTKIM